MGDRRICRIRAHCISLSADDFSGISGPIVRIPGSPGIRIIMKMARRVRRAQTSAKNGLTYI
jgi:hypothetical protein